ncbi:L-amino acid N-acyltransferase YncA [Reichenbachiella faecimaris]|uniref:L-amino acid N-acyltransferase YncA n=1 Tax=Reichenbachiella faecimaris TaxID=692418 RepID=A0A1W2GNT5_REIFA|nr:GNAT family N-acetyltransferase [Reichenbachiella faecimaris]SMD38297.1 L-amino acid N-acyltransferase YncA [Reichenbachiella faecimaris]
MNTRKATLRDYDAIWDIFQSVIKTGDTYVFDPETPIEDLQKHWFADLMDTFVAEKDGRILGTYIIKPNQPDLGNHIANASYMIHPDAQGKGIGQLLGEHSIHYAKQKGYHAIQFNLVVSTNTAAVQLWKKFGFEIIGTTPNGFRHQSLGLVDTYMMYKKL